MIDQRFLEDCLSSLLRRVSMVVRLMLALCSHTYRSTAAHTFYPLPEHCVTFCVPDVHHNMAKCGRITTCLATALKLPAHSHFA